MTRLDVASGMSLLLYSCPYNRCGFNTADRCLFLHHVVASAPDTTHKAIFDVLLSEGLNSVSRLHHVYGAAAVAERGRWPQLGLSTTRRDFNTVCSRCSNAGIKCVACFVCAQLRTTVSGYPRIDLTQAVQCEKRCDTEVDWRGDGTY